MMRRLGRQLGKCKESEHSQPILDGYEHDTLAGQVIPYGLTVISRSKDTRKLAGVFLTDDFASPPALNPKLQTKLFSWK